MLLLGKSCMRGRVGALTFFYSYHIDFTNKEMKKAKTNDPKCQCKRSVLKNIDSSNEAKKNWRTFFFLFCNIIIKILLLFAAAAACFTKVSLALPLPTTHTHDPLTFLTTTLLSLIWFFPIYLFYKSPFLFAAFSCHVCINVSLYVYVCMYGTLEGFDGAGRRSNDIVCCSP